MMWTCLTGQSPDCTLVQSKEDDFDWEQGDTRDRPNSNPWIPAGQEPGCLWSPTNHCWPPPHIKDHFTKNKPVNRDDEFLSLKPPVHTLTDLFCARFFLILGVYWWSKWMRLWSDHPSRVWRCKRVRIWVTALWSRWSCFFTWTCVPLHHLSFTNTNNPPFIFPLSTTLRSVPTSLNLSRETTVSSIGPFNHVSIKHNRLHYQFSLWFRISTASSSVLLEMERTFPIITEGRHGLYLRFLQSPLQPRLLCISAGISPLHMSHTQESRLLCMVAPVRWSCV
ncbi:hypothetical protein GOODEAATRI_015303 [Goodea atripinnis]|uniref:Uncharacterized protein n=1 Tax=Goodea atripinnis TaxID=208336 RepID=A0ABV0PYA7_9TELE